MFTTDRLHLRAWREGDDENILSLFNNAHLAPSFAPDFIVPRGPKHKEFMNKMAEDALMYCVIEEKETNKYMGVVGFENKPDGKNRRGQFVIGMLPEFWRKGYGEEASRFVIDYGFRSLGLHRISLGVFEGNDRAIALYRRLGFVDEGTLRKQLWKDGGWWDVYLMGLLEDEWATAQKSTTASGR
ncbi:acyl-CoA N-acyltransferase [Crucibulum laeve]|uniref:Acyl-CoA N-acyltransferase n=1 Tax=Crucibulum laeve TaxID=68775 RepID=A0A5C3M813_9AGAR|nr:acyl-CoA N-acyltransferase [Crucibulum laeve]